MCHIFPLRHDGSAMSYNLDKKVQISTILTELPSSGELMKITSQEEYGLRCLMRLARAEGQSATLPEIAAAEGLSVPYVAKFMTVLRQAGLIDSVRGRAGGYRLAKKPDDIGLGSLLLVLGEPLFDEPNYCQRHAGAASDGNCVHHGGCSLRALW